LCEKCVGNYLTMVIELDTKIPTRVVSLDTLL